MAYVLSPNNKRRRESDGFVYAGKGLNTNQGFLDMETKSIADILSARVVENPYEVVRKPPKKKKKNEPLTFDNEALNLNTPEKQFNPFEVQRPECKVDNDCNSYVNLGLNLKAPESTNAKNPFEIIRSVEYPEVEQKSVQEGIENPAMDLPRPIAIAVPFTPSVNHRITFHQVKTPPNSMTPSEMLSKSLRFTPEVAINATPRRSCRKNLSTISEEALNIDEELDCYQLELENSINEAKSVNRKYFADLRKGVVKKEATKIHHPPPPQPDVVYEGDENDEDAPTVEEEMQFKNPQPFQRAYRRPVAPTAPPGLPKESTGSEIKSSIRRSIRKITNIAKKPKKTANESKENYNSTEEISAQKSDRVSGNKLMASIRQSLRLNRKVPQEEQENNVLMNVLNTTIIETETRTVFREIQGDAFVRKSTLRRSTRQVLKNVFKKNVEGYEVELATK
ncbi:uncharacterized protein LOC129786085 [Lutzomyia longipalpis]|uniref:uncharacterized protein LOC129786085 n=1 Tax=Lutzomyia longipalpis TaxID=7200 RepID=UPI00248444E1|nr:uncharacterized protein LOC129786085 [Lutzomyia longipalpis]